MIKKKGFPKIFFGWWIVLTGGVLCLWGYGYQTYGISALFKPISSELGFSRAATSVASSIGKLEGGIEAPLTGWLTDKFGPRWIILSGVVIIGLGLILMNFIHSLWAYYVVWGVLLGTGVNIALSIPVQTAITNWFVRKRGLASGIFWVFSGLSGALVLPLVAWLITIQGWRITCVIGGVVMWLIGLPLAWFFIKQHRPEYYGLLPDGARAKEEAKDTSQMIEKGVKYAAEVEEVEFTLRQALRTPAYWLLLVANACHSLSAPAIEIHCIPFLTDIGIDPLKAAGMLAIMMLASIPSRLVGGFLADRLKKGHLRFLMGGAYFLEAAGFAIFLLNQTTPMIFVWFILYGIGMGVHMAPASLLRARYFGRKAFGSIGGSMSIFMTPVGVLAPIYTGWVYDKTGSYMSAFVLLAALMAVTGVLFPLLIRRPRPPEQVTDIRKIL